MTTTTHFRACPLCEAICGLELRYTDGALNAIRGDAADPFSRGHICPKGNAILDLESDPDRLRTPMRRVGDTWTPIGWDDAFALAGEKLAGVQAAHGPSALAVYLGNPNVHHFGHIAYLPAALKLLRTPNVFSASSVDQWPHQLVVALMYGHHFLLPIPDIDRTEYFLMLGANPIASNGSLMTVPDVAARLKALTRRGKLVVLDPRRTETAAIASEHHFIRPGSDALFLIAFLQALPAPRVAAYGEKLRGLDEALAAIRAFDVGDVAQQTGVDAATIQRLAQEFAAAPSAVAYGRVGLSTQRWGSLCQWLLQLINLVSGNLDRAGGALLNDAAIPVTGAGPARGGTERYGRWHSRVRKLPEFAGELPVAALAEEIATPGDGQVRALLTVAGNPVLSTPDGRALDRALGTLDFYLAIDIYRNETTRHADLILPPASPLTQDHYDLIFNALAVRRVARLNTPVSPRADNERADWEIFNGIARAYAQAAGREWRDQPPPRAMIAAGLARGGSGLTLEDLERAPHGIDLGPLTPSLLRRLQTESGCIECAPPLLLDELRRLAAERAPARDDALLLIGRRDIRSNNSWMHNAPRLIKGKPRHQLLMHPADLAARGIGDGGRVRVRSRVGQIDTEVKSSADVMPGVVCLPHGFGHGRAGAQLSRAQALAGESYNDLSDATALDASGNAALNGIRVWVEAIA